MDEVPGEVIGEGDEVEEEEEQEEDPELTKAKEENAALRALLQHHGGEGMDIDAELDNIAYRRDGTPVYIGGGKPSKGGDEEKERRPVQRSERQRELQRPSRTPDIKSMTHEERSKHYQKVALPEARRTMPRRR